MVNCIEKIITYIVCVIFPTCKYMSIVLYIRFALVVYILFLERHSLYESYCEKTYHETCANVPDRTVFRFCLIDSCQHTLLLQEGKL